MPFLPIYASSCSDLSVVDNSWDFPHEYIISAAPPTSFSLAVRLFWYGLVFGRTVLGVVRVYRLIVNPSYDFTVSRQ